MSAKVVLNIANAYLKSVNTLGSHHLAVRQPMIVEITNIYLNKYRDYQHRLSSLIRSRSSIPTNIILGRCPDSKKLMGQSRKKVYGLNKIRWIEAQITLQPPMHTYFLIYSQNNLISR